MSKLLLVADVESWCWWRRCKGIATPESRVITEAHYQRGDIKQYDGGLWSSWFTCLEPDRWTALVANEGIKYEYPCKQDSSNLRTLMASRWKNIQAARDKLPRYKKVICVNKHCVEFCRTLNPNTVYLRTGVDTNFWKPTSPIRTSGKLRVGWCGKPSTSEKFSPKGWSEVLQPLIRSMDGSVEFVVNDRTHANRLNDDEMLQWYNSIDVFLCTSCSEGTPSSLQEAAACGRPFVSTDVGIVREMYRASSGAMGKIAGAWCDVANARRVAQSIAFDLMLIGRDRERLVRMGGVARSVMENQFSWNVLRDIWQKEICDA